MIKANQTCQIWDYRDFVIHEFESVDSTNSLAFDLAKESRISNQEIILAKQQTQGRGRLNRQWQSPSGNLYFSLVLKNPEIFKVSTQNIVQISFLTVVALGLAIEELLKNLPNSSQKSPEINFKWPNDLLINRKKIAGILLESDFVSSVCQFVVIGIGLNNQNFPEITSEDNKNTSKFTYTATSLQEFGLEISNKNLLKNFLDKFSAIYRQWTSFGFEFIQNLWMKKAFQLNQRILVNLNGEKIEGIFLGINETGKLLLRSSNQTFEISNWE